MWKYDSISIDPITKLELKAIARRKGVPLTVLLRNFVNAERT